MRHRLVVLILSIVVLAALGPPASGAGREQVLDGPRNGAAAVEALGERLPDVARAHDTTAAALRQRLEQDASLWVDVSGRLFYIDPAAPDHVEADTTTVAADPALAEADPLALHSRLGAQRTIYLDFDGHGAAYGEPLGDGWSSGYTGGDGTAEPYNSDGDASSFSAKELDEIRSIWLRVAEDFAPFDVDVTTETPAYEDINRSSSADGSYGTRVVLTSSSTNCGCGGVAYVGVFDLYGGNGHAYYQPALVYNTGAKAAAEAASHEAGHNLGLSHDGTRSTGYYAGHGDWAPIMGVGYYEPISQWSRGEYAGANNTEDDFAVAVGHGAPLLADEADQNAGTLTETTALRASGTIERAADVDRFTFTTDVAHSATITATPAPTSPNLDIKVTLSGDGEVLAAVDPPSGAVTADVAAGLDAQLVTDLPAGTYSVTVEGVGVGDAASSGYSDYGSVGDYTVSIVLGAATGGGTQDPPLTPPAAPTIGSATASAGAVTVTWTDNSENEDGFEVRREKKSRKGWSQTLLPLTAVDAQSLQDSPGSGTFRYSVRARNTAGDSAWSGYSGEVTISTGSSGKGGGGGKK